MSKCIYCGEEAEFKISGDRPCCREKARLCPNFKKIISEWAKKYNKEHPEKVKEHLKKLSEMQRDPEIIEKKRAAMKRLHTGTDEKSLLFQKRYRESKEKQKQKTIEKYREYLKKFDIDINTIPPDELSCCLAKLSYYCKKIKLKED